MADGKNILVRAPNWIGDAVMSMPACVALKRLYPRARITVLAKGRVMPVFENMPEADSIMEYADTGRHRGLVGKLKLRGEIKERGFDTAVLFQNAFDAAFLSFISGVPERVGYARDLRTRLLTRPVPVTPEIKRVHQVYYYLNIIKALGPVSPAEARPRIRVSREESRWARDFLKGKGLAGAVLIGAAPGASYGPAKRWMPERFAAALNGLAGGVRGAVVIFGGPDDRGVCSEVCDGVRADRLNLAGAVSLRQFIALAAEMKVFITNDSGPMHISAALGTPTVAVFGSTDPALTGPLGKKARVIRKKAECAPCFERECGFKHYKCLNVVEPAEVIEAARAVAGL